MPHYELGSHEGPDMPYITFWGRKGGGAVIGGIGGRILVGKSSLLVTAIT